MMTSFVPYIHRNCSLEISSQAVPTIVLYSFLPMKSWSSPRIFKSKCTESYTWISFLWGKELWIDHEGRVAPVMKFARLSGDHWSQILLKGNSSRAIVRIEGFFRGLTYLSFEDCRPIGIRTKDSLDSIPKIYD